MSTGLISPASADPRPTLSAAACDSLFRTARTHRAWHDRPVADSLLRERYHLMKWGPTSTNGCPARIIFLRTRQAKERLRPALMSGNVDKTMLAPVTAILASDAQFFELLPWLFPSAPAMKDAYMKITGAGRDHGAPQQQPARSLFYPRRSIPGPRLRPNVRFRQRPSRSGIFPPSSSDQANHAGDFVAVGAIKSNFLCNLGYGDAAKLNPPQSAPRFQRALPVALAACRT